MTSWIRLQIKLSKDYNPTLPQLEAFVESIERELKGFSQIEEVILEDHLILEVKE